MAVYVYERLLGPIIRLGAADQDINALQRSLEAISDIKAHTVYPDIEADGQTVIMRALNYSPPKPIIGVRVGGIAHNLRAALDDIAWQMAILSNPAIATDSLAAHDARGTQFPIFLYEKEVPNVLESRNHFSNAGINKHLGCIPDTTHRALFECHQPYKVGNGGENDALWLLKEMNDTDKHRFIQTTLLVTRNTAVSITDALGNTIPDSVEVPVSGAFVTGAELFRFRTSGRSVNMQYDIPLEVRFGKGCEAIEGRPVIATLRAMHNRVDRIMRDTFFPVLKL